MSEIQQSEAQHIRYDRLKTVCNRALEESQKVLSDENLIACYPSLNSSNKGKHLLETIKIQLTETWRENTLVEFDAIFKEREIESKLDELDELIEIATKRQNGDGGVPIEELSSTNILSSHMIPIKQKNLERLKQQVNVSRQGNIDLLNELKGQLEEARLIKDDVTDSLQTIKNLNVLSEDSKFENDLNELIEITKQEDYNEN